MKTTRYIFAAIAIASAVSCQKEGFVEPENTRGLEAVTITTGESTKTTLNGKEIHWTSDDVIAVFDNAGGRNTFNVEKCDGKKATFSGSVTSGTSRIYAVYPENLAVSAEGDVIKVKIPSNQTPKAGSFDEEHNIAVAKGTKIPGNPEIENITFKNVCGLLKFTIPAYIEDAASVTFESKNAIAGEMTVDYSGDAPVSTISTDGSTSITMSGSYEAGSEFIFVLAPGILDGFKVTVTTEQANWSIERDTKVEILAGNYRNLGTLALEPIEVSASAAHSYSNGTLTGTDVTVNLNIPTATQQYVTALNLVVKNSAGNEVRNLSKSGASSTEIIPADSENPYLPQGEYTVSGTYTLSGNVVKEIDAVSFTSPAPTFTVKSNAYSSYTKYCQGDSKTANGLNALTIYDVTSSSVSIADAILTKHASLHSKAYTVKGAACEASTYTATEYGPHTVTATHTFDGVSVNGSSDCHITGLPYTLNTTANDSMNAWSESGNVAWESSQVKLGHNQWGGEAYINKSYNLPANVNAIVNCNGNVYGTGSWIKVSNTFSIVISDNEVFSASCNGNSGVSFACSSKAATINSNNATIKLNSSYNLEQARVLITSFSVIYGTK